MLSFPRVVCLATPVEDPDRFAATQRHFSERGLGTVSFLHGLHSSVSGLNTSHPYDVDNPGTGFKMGAKPTHIWLGHYMIWQALRLSDDQHWLVLECDVEFPEDWARRYRDALDHVPADFDLLYVGNCCCQGRERKHAGGDVYEVIGPVPQCNHGYVLARKAVPVLERTLRRVWAPIDIQQASECFEHGYALPNSLPFEEPERRLKVYAVLPRILGQFNTDLPE